MHVIFYQKSHAHQNLPSSLPPAARCAPPSTEPQAPPTHPHIATQALAAKLELVRVSRTPGFSLPAPLQDPTTAKKTSKPAPGTRCTFPVSVCFASDTHPLVSTLPPAGAFMEECKPAMSCKTISNHPASLFHCGSVHPVFSDTERASLFPDQILGRPCQLSLSSSALRRTVQPPGAGGPSVGSWSLRVSCVKSIMLRILQSWRCSVSSISKPPPCPRPWPGRRTNLTTLDHLALQLHLARSQPGSHQCSAATFQFPSRAWSYCGQKAHIHQFSVSTEEK